MKLKVAKITHYQLKNILIKLDQWQKWHYLEVTHLSGSLRGITLKNNVDFYSLDCLHFFKTKNTLE